ncbi:MAG: N-acetylglucosamine-6-phosphate deacetylase [Acidimicrobiia bacterium]|jgi:N-acetylglucosamine-6-phosphate deacetylase
MTGLVLRNGRIVSDGRVVDGDLLIQDRRIAAVGRVSSPPGTPTTDLGGATVLPGLVDLQVNGLGGTEVYRADRAGLVDITRTAARLGCTSLLLTQISGDPESYVELAAALGEAPDGGARILGVHLEGPYLDPGHPGAHPRDALRPPNADEARLLLSHFGDRVRVWTLAPELPGAEQVVDLLLESGVVVSAGHSGATFDEARSWFRRGVTLVTHLFNAMSGLDHREPGLAAAALLDAEVSFSVIADGHHASPEMVRLAHRLGRERLILITDAVAPAGAPDGTYTVAGQEVRAADGTVRLPGGRLAGSVLRPLDAVKNLARFTGLSIAEASVAMTSRPADLLGLPELGRLAEGCVADFLVLDDGEELAETWINGRPVHRRPGTEAEA